MVSPVYSSLPMLLSIMRVHGNLTPWYHQCISLPCAVEHHVGSRKSNPMVSPVVSLFLPLIASSFSASPLMTIVWLHLILILWDTMTKGTASGYPLITLLRIGIHGPRSYLHSYRDIYVLSFRTVGMKLDSNCCPYLLSPTVSAPRTRCLGSQVARFAGPFESRPTDPIRREVYRQLASNSSSASSSGWVAPTATLAYHTSPTGKRHWGECHGSIAL